MKKVVMCSQCKEYYSNGWTYQDVYAIEKTGKCVQCLLLFVAPKQDKND